MKKKSVENFFCRNDFTPFISKSFQTSDHFFPLRFPKDSENLKKFDIGLWEVGAKRRLSGTSKVNRQTDKHMDKSTYRKHRPKEPML